MITAQKDDATLDKYREYAKTGTRKFTGQQNVSWFVIEDDMLFRYFQSPKVSNNNIFKQLVVPSPHRMTVIKLAHDCVLSGHLESKRRQIGCCQTSIGQEYKEMLVGIVDPATCVSELCRKVKFPQFHYSLCL